MAEEKLHILGVEATQATQHFDSSQFLSNPADRGPNNSIELVRGKSLVLRVYPAAVNVDSIDGVSISFRLRRRNSPQKWRTLTSALVRLTQGVMTVERGLTALAMRYPGHSFDLLLPARDAFGLLRFEATISAPGADPASIDVTFALKLEQTFILNAVLISYQGPASRDPGVPALDLAPPTFQEFRNTAAWAINCFPVSATADIHLMGEMEYAQPLTPLNNDAKSPWVRLQAALLQAALAMPDARGGVIHGLLPASLLNHYALGVGGYGGNNVGVSFAGRGRDLAHEFGHSASLGHAPCPPTIDDPDPDFPVYPHPFGPSPAAHIGEFGMDCSSGAVLHFEAYRDFMSDCGPAFWISPYHYRKLLRNPIFDWRDLPLELPPENILQPVRGMPKKWLPDPVPPFPRGIAVIALAGPRGEVEIRYVTRCQVNPAWAAGEPSGLKIQLIGARNKVLAEAPLQHSSGQALGRPVNDANSTGQPQHGVLTGVIRYAGRGESLRVVKGKRVLSSRRAPARAMRVSGFKAKVVDGRLVASWDAVPARGDDVHFWLRWRLRGDKAWNALKTGILQSPARVELQGLPSGRIEIGLAAHNGFDSVDAKPAAVTVPQRSPAPVIFHPRDGVSLKAGGMIRLWGNAALCNGDYAKPAALVWTIDGKRVGRGDDIWVAAPAPGAHECVLTAKDSNRRQEHRVRFITREPSQE